MLVYEGMAKWKGLLSEGLKCVFLLPMVGVEGLEIFISYFIIRNIFSYQGTHLDFKHVKFIGTQAL